MGCIVKIEPNWHYETVRQKRLARRRLKVLLSAFAKAGAIVLAIALIAPFLV